VEQIRDVLETVLRDLEDVSEQLSRAEHEKDVAETEIEQLRESLRRLHR
jgi:cob(I)alamin adenosyltransferase